MGEVLHHQALHQGSSDRKWACNGTISATVLPWEPAVKLTFGSRQDADTDALCSIVLGNIWAYGNGSKPIISDGFRDEYCINLPRVVGFWHISISSQHCFLKRQMKCPLLWWYSRIALSFGGKQEDPFHGSPSPQHNSFTSRWRDSEKGVDGYEVSNHMKPQHGSKCSTKQTSLPSGKLT